jgi:CRISPR type III-A-associated protein Csm2
MMNFYTHGGSIRPDLFDTEASKWAGKMEKVSRAQMRRFFDEIKRLERKMNSKEKWEDILPYIKMEKSKIVYTVARAKKNCKNEDKQAYDNLKAFIFECIDAINKPDDYKIFSQFMEAVYGFHYENAPEK